MAVLRLPAITKLTPSASFTLGNKKKSISINGRVFQMLDGIFGAPTPTIHYSTGYSSNVNRSVIPVES